MAITWAVVQNASAHNVVISDGDLTVSLSPSGYPGSIQAVHSALFDDSAIAQRLLSDGTIMSTKSDSVPPGMQWPRYLPTDRWQRIGVIDVVLGDDNRASTIINIQPVHETGVSQDQGERWVKSDLRLILDTSARWLEELGDERSQARLIAVRKRLEEIRSL